MPAQAGEVLAILPCGGWVGNSKRGQRGAAARESKNWLPLRPRLLLRKKGCRTFLWVATYPAHCLLHVEDRDRLISRELPADRPCLLRSAFSRQEGKFLATLGRVQTYFQLPFHPFGKTLGHVGSAYEIFILITITI